MSYTYCKTIIVNGISYKVSKRYVQYGYPIPTESDSMDGPWMKCDKAT